MFEHTSILLGCAGLGEGFACSIEGVLDRRVVRMLRAKHPSPLLADVVERFHSLDEIIERGVFRVTESIRIEPAQLEPMQSLHVLHAEEGPQHFL